jgi:hypothetical protein
MILVFTRQFFGSRSNPIPVSILVDRTIMAMLLYT